MAARGIRVEHMAGGRSRLVHAVISDANARRSGGGHHEGALLALLDTTGAMAAWAETGPGRFKASTPALQAQVLAPAPAADLVAYGRLATRDGEPSSPTSRWPPPATAGSGPGNGALSHRWGLGTAFGRRLQGLAFRRRLQGRWSCPGFVDT